MDEGKSFIGCKQRPVVAKKVVGHDDAQLNNIFLSKEKYIERSSLGKDIKNLLIWSERRKLVMIYGYIFEGYSY